MMPLRPFFKMTSAEVDAAAERYYDRLYDLYYGTGEDAWDHYGPDWKEVQDILSDYDDEQIADLVRDAIEGDGDLMVEISNAGLLDGYIAPEDKWKLKDPDDQWPLVDEIFQKQWENNDLMVTIWEKFDKVAELVSKRAWEDADNDYDNDIRQKYNESKEEHYDE